MVESETRTDAPTQTQSNGASHEPLEEVGDAIDDALRSGIPVEEIRKFLSMLEFRVYEHEVGYQPTLPAFPDDDPDTVYTELPPGLIDVPTATQKYNLNRGTLRTWLKKGRIRVLGRLKAPATGGGYLLVDEEELLAHMSAPKSKGGRPRKTNSH